jgi:hypothetical protein
MKRLLPVLCLLSSVLCIPSSATELTDLGQGLSYLRIHSVADSEAALRKAVPGAGALVLDLRYATASDASSAGLRSTLATRSSNAPLFILVSPATPPVLGPVISASRALTLGLAGSLPMPKVIVQTDAATDRQAYDALDTGTALQKLISGKIEKERFDEATLVQEFRNGNPDAAPIPPPDPTVAKPAGALEKEPPAPLVDRVLQRAVHLHRALLALKPRS